MIRYVIRDSLICLAIENHLSSEFSLEVAMISSFHYKIEDHIDYGPGNPEDHSSYVAFDDVLFDHELADRSSFVI
jgi:hypothetical protein